MTERDEVRRWLEREGLPADEVTVQGVLWVLVTRYPVDGPVTQIASPHDGLVVVARRVTVSDEHVRGLQALEPARFREFHYSVLRDLLLSRGVAYSLEVSDESRELKFFTVGYELREEPLTASLLFNALRDVNDAMLLVTIRIRMIAGGNL